VHALSVGNPPPLGVGREGALRRGERSVTAPQETLGQARGHLRRVIDQLEAIRWQLIGITLSLPQPLAEQARFEDVSEEVDAATDLRTTIECVLEDEIRKALQDLRDVLPSPAQGGAP
jgi:hypothetical protein